MSSSTSDSFVTIRSYPSRVATSQRAGLVVFGIGVLYMLGMGWLASWWVVPVIRHSGLEGLPGTAFFFLWQLAAPVGAFLMAIGAAFIACVERSRKAAVIGGSLLTTIWLIISVGVIKEVVPPIFGIGGGLISLAFLGAMWEWARWRPHLTRPDRLGADLGMAGQVFYLIAAWYLCGLLGAPTFLLRPEQAMTIIPENNAISLGTTILICMTLGSVLTFFSRRVTQQSQNKPV